MERIFSSFSLITLGFSELYLALAEVLLTKVRKVVNIMMLPTICVGMLITLFAFTFGFASVNHTLVTSKVSVSTVSPLVKELAVVINDSHDNKIDNYLNTKMSNLVYSTIRESPSVSRGGFSDRFMRPLNSEVTQVSESTTTETPPGIDINQYTDWTSDIGSKVIQTKFGSLVKCGLPSDYGNDVDFSTFKPYENYQAITARGTVAYKVTHADAAYNDDKGFRRYYTHGSSEFTVNNHIGDNGALYGEDDYIVALGTYYIGNGCKEGQRFLIVGENGMYTVRIGDEKADKDTDGKHMYSYHEWCGDSYAGLIEFIVSPPDLEPSVRCDGTVDSTSVKALSGKIKAIYRIDS